MATRRKTNGRAQRGFLEKAAIGALKLGGGGAVGATIGATEEGLGESAGIVVKGAFAAAGLAGELFLRDEASTLREMSKAAMYGSSGVQGYQTGKSVMRRVLDANRERTLAAMKNGLAEDMAADDDAEAVPVKRRRAKGKGNAAEAE